MSLTDTPEYGMDHRGLNRNDIPYYYQDVLLPILTSVDQRPVVIRTHPDVTVTDPNVSATSRCHRDIPMSPQALYMDMPFSVEVKGHS